MSATPAPIWPASAVAALADTDQAVPFQCRASGAKSERFTWVRPMAQASVALLALTAARLAVFPGVAGVATWVQAVPFQWSMRTLAPTPLSCGVLAANRPGAGIGCRADAG